MFNTSKKLVISKQFHKIANYLFFKHFLLKTNVTNFVENKNIGKNDCKSKLFRHF
jgi:hypothetical protein